MKHKRATQKSKFDGIRVNNPPKVVSNSKDKGKKRSSGSVDFKDSSESSSQYGSQEAIKRRKPSNVIGSTIMECFFVSMYKNMMKEVSASHPNTKKLSSLKEKYLTKNLPPNINKEAAMLAHCEKKDLIKYFETEPNVKLGRTYWREFVELNFDMVTKSLSDASSSSSTESSVSKINFSGMGEFGSVDVVKSMILEPSGEGSSQVSLPDISSIDVSSQMSGIEESEQESETISTDQEISDFRTFSVSLNSIRRKDLDDDTINIFNEKIDTTLRNTSEYVMEYQCLVHSMMLGIKNVRFVDNGDGHLSLEDNIGLNTSSIFPQGFQFHEIIEFSSTVISKEILGDEKLSDELNTLFTSQHLKYIDSAFFGVQGVRVKYQLQDKLHEIVSSSHSKALKEKTHPTKTVREIALMTYLTNFQNMWSKNTIFNKVLDKLLTILLRIHLAPKREKEYRKFIEEKNNKSAEIIQKNGPLDVANSESEVANIGKLSRNKKRDILRNEYYQQKKYEMKKAKAKPDDQPKWDLKIEKSKNRIKKYKDINKKENSSKSEKSVQGDDGGEDDSGTDDVDASIEEEELMTHSEILEEEDTKNDFSGDISRRQLGRLKAGIKTLVLKRNGEQVTKEDFIAVIDNASNNEVNCCLQILNVILPFIPPKEKCNTIIQQLPFVLLANDLLRCAGYRKHAVDICPLSSLTTLHAIRFDGPSLYDVMCRGNNKMFIYDFEGYNITSIEQSREHKDAVFSSFFDIISLYDSCNSRGLDFGYSITVLPGCKTAKILGTKKKPSISKKVKEKSGKSRLDDDTKKDIAVQRLKDDAVLKQEVADLEKNIKDLEVTLKNETKELQKEDYGKSINDTKKKWISGVVKKLTEKDKTKNQSTYNEVNVLKDKRTKLIADLQKTRTELSDKRYQQFIRKRAVNIRKEDHTQSENRERSSIKSQSNSFNKAEDVVLEEKQASNYVFSGTDNGIVKMTETVPFDVERFKYHIDLYNNFSSMADTHAQEPKEREEVSQPEFISLPKPFTIHPGDVDIGCGHWRRRMWLQKRKKTTPEGIEVQEIEKILSKINLDKSTSTEDIAMTYKESQKYRKKLQSFYYSKKQVKQVRKTEILIKKYKEKICSKERKRCNPKESKNQKKRLVMFVGDKGIGVGSKIKGHRRYGGKWHPILHSRNINLCITNENFTSQTCIYCFSKLSNPKYRIQKKGKTSLRSVHGAFMCTNQNCISVKNKRAIQTRDSLSAVAIGLVGLSTVILNSRIPPFTRYNTNQAYARFKELTETESFVSM